MNNFLLTTVKFYHRMQYRYDSLLPGNPELVAEYKGKLFCFSSEKNQEKFMRYTIYVNYCTVTVHNIILLFKYHDNDSHFVLNNSVATKPKKMATAAHLSSVSSKTKTIISSFFRAYSSEGVSTLQMAYFF